MTTVANADYFISYLKPYATDICVAAVFGLGYFIYKAVRKSQENPEELALQKDPKAISKTWNKWEQANSLNKYHQYINFNQDKNVDAFYILDKMQKNHILPDIVTYNCLLDMSFSLGQILQATKLYEEISDFTSPVQPEIITYNIILKGCVKQIKENCGNNEELDRIFNRINSFLKDMQNKNIQRNDITYNTLIDAFAEGGRIEKSWEIYNDMKTNNLKPDLYTYATLIKALKSLPFSEDNFNQAIEIFELVKSKSIEGLKADDFLYNSMLDTCLKYGKIELLEKLFSEMKTEGISPSVVTYSIMIKAYGNTINLEKSLHYFNELRSNKIMANDIIYGCILNCCVKCSKPELMTEMFEDMKKEGILPNLYIYTTMIKGYNKMKQYNLAFKVFEKMKEDDYVKPNIVIYNAIIDNCVESKDYNKMFEIYTHLKNNESTIQPNIITYSTLIKGFCKSGNMKKAQDIFDFLVENKIKLDDVVFNTLCDGYAKLKDVDNAIRIYNEMKKTGIKRTAVIYTVLIKMYSCLGEEKKVNEMFHEMKEEGIKPTVVVYTSIIQVLNRYKKTEEVINIYNMVKKDTSLKIDSLMYSFVINGCCFNKKLEKAIEILMESIKEGIKLNEETYNNVLEYLLANKFMKQYERIQNCSMICKALKDRNYQINLDLYNRVMKVLYNSSESNGTKNNTGKKYK